MTQKEALKTLYSDQNVFLTGIPGSGKSYLISQYIAYLKKRKIKVAVTASTGIAASQIGGITIHSWSGIGIYSNLDKDRFRDIYQKSYLQRRFNEVEVLIIDEISMLNSQILDSLNSLAKYFRKNNYPMGKIKTVLVGDFFQLPPVEVNNIKSEYAFLSECWKDLKLAVCYLQDTHRQTQSDPLNKILEQIRRGHLDESSSVLLKKRINLKVPNNIPHLYPYNYDVDLENNSRNNLLMTIGFRYKIKHKGSMIYVRNFINQIGLKDNFDLKIGSRVMFICNDFNKGFMNGSLGMVNDFIDGLPLVRLDNGKYIKVEEHLWTIEIDNKIVGEVMALPLKLAWAITIHKSQGMSLDMAEIDLGRSFAPGMGYVALSRVRSLEGVFLKSFNKNALFLDGKVSKMDKIWQTI